MHVTSPRGLKLPLVLMAMLVYLWLVTFPTHAHVWSQMAGHESGRYRSLGSNVNSEVGSRQD